MGWQLSHCLPLSLLSDALSNEDCERYSMKTFLGIFGASGRGYIHVTVALILLVILMSIPYETPAQAAGNNCISSGPSGGTYTVTACFTSPANGATVSGNQTVSVTVTLVGPKYRHFAADLLFERSIFDHGFPKPVYLCPAHDQVGGRQPGTVGRGNHERRLHFPTILDHNYVQQRHYYSAGEP